MIPQETLALQRLGRDLVASVVQLAVLVFLYGVALIIFAISFTKLMQRGLDSRPRRIIFGACVISLILITLTWVTNLGQILRLLMVTFVHANDGTLSSNSKIVGVRLDGGLVVLDIVQAFAIQLLPLVGDGIVVWRAWALFPDRRWVMLFPSLLLLATVATTVFTIVNQIIFYVRVGSQGSGSAFFLANGFLLPLSLVTNIVATLLIWYKLWTHRKFVKDLGVHNKRSPVERTVVALIESGVIYCILQAVTFVLSFGLASSLGGAVTVNVFICIYFIVAGTYPSLVVIFVSEQRSIVQTYGFDSALNRAQNGFESRNENSSASVKGSGRPATPGHLSFAAATTETFLSSTSMTECAVHVGVPSVHTGLTLAPQRRRDISNRDVEKGLYQSAAETGR